MTPVIEVFADVRCPFTHVGLARFVARRRERGLEEPRLRVRAWPLELVNGEPLAPDLIADEVEALRDQVAPDLFRAFDPLGLPASSLGPLALAAAAYRASVIVGEAVSLALREELFEQGNDIADPGRIAGIAAAFAINEPGPGDDAQVINDWHEGQRRGVVGSPHFFLGDEGYFCPTLEITHVDGELRVRTDEAALHEFLDRVFQP